MQLSLTEASFNAAACLIVVTCVMTTVSSVYYKGALFLYACFALPMILLPYGGQVNLGLSVGVLSLLLLQYMSRYSVPVRQTEKKVAVPIFTGKMSSRLNIGRRFNTFAPGLPAYKMLPRSVNRVGGEQFTYNFWLQLENSLSNEDVSGKTLLLRGDAGKYRVYRAGVGEDERYVIACPRISFVSTNKLAVEINTDKDLIARFEIGNNMADETLRKNILSLIPGSFAMMTFVFQDRYDKEKFDNGFVMTFYFNGARYHRSSHSGSIRVNDAPLYVFVDEDDKGIKGCNMADLTYFNYALSNDEIGRLYSRSFSNKDAVENGATAGKSPSTLVTSPFNNLDLLNFDYSLVS